TQKKLGVMRVGWWNDSRSAANQALASDKAIVADSMPTAVRRPTRASSRPPSARKIVGFLKPSCAARLQRRLMHRPLDGDHHTLPVIQSVYGCLSREPSARRRQAHALQTRDQSVPLLRVWPRRGGNQRATAYNR